MGRIYGCKSIIPEDIDTSLQESAMAYTLWESTSVLNGGADAPKRGSRSPLATPYEAYRAKDNFIVVAVPSEYHWGVFCKGINAPHLKEDPRFVDRLNRLANRDILQAEIEKALASNTADYWSAQLTLLKIPSSPVNTVKKALVDPQIKSRGMIETINGQSFLRVPIKMSKTPTGISRPVAALGEHTIEVLKEAGFSEGELEDLIRNGIVKIS